MDNQQPSPFKMGKVHRLSRKRVLRNNLFLGKRGTFTKLISIFVYAKNIRKF